MLESINLITFREEWNFVNLKMKVNKPYILLLLIATSIFSIIDLNAQSTVEEKANLDQIYGKTWQALGPKLNTVIKNCNNRDILSELSNKYNLNSTILRRFLIYTQNYTNTELSLEKVLYRYPHYNADSIKVDFKTLSSFKLINKDEVSREYHTTHRGNQILDSYWQLRMTQTKDCNTISEEHLNIFKTVLEKIVIEAKNLEEYGSQSVKWRMKSRSKDFNNFPIILQVSELLKEYTAFVNDVGHYKYNHLISQTNNTNWVDLKLSPLAKELMSATRNKRIYDLNRCYNQPNWRVGKLGCNIAVEELIKIGFIELNEQDINQTNQGSEISILAEALSDKIRYSTWGTITVNEYEEFVEGISWMLKNSQ